MGWGEGEPRGHRPQSRAIAARCLFAAQAPCTSFRAALSDCSDAHASPSRPCRASPAQEPDEAEQVIPCKIIFFRLAMKMVHKWRISKKIR